MRVSRRRWARQGIRSYPGDFTRSKSVTYFDIHLGKGDEIADYSISYNTASTETKSYSKFYYEGDKTASQLTAADTDAAMVRSESFKKALGKAGDTVIPGDFTRSKSVTYFDIHLGKGDEIADYSISYNTASTETKSCSKFYYEGDKTASQLTAADTDAAIVRSEIFKKALGKAGDTVDPLDFTRSKSVTYFDIHLGKGDEIADYSISYNTASTETKSYSKFYYEGDKTASKLIRGGYGRGDGAQ